MTTWDPPPGGRRGLPVAPAKPLRWRDARRAAQPPPRANTIDLEYRPTSRLASRVGMDSDGVFAFLLFLPLLFMVQLGTMGAVAFAALTPIYLYVRRATLGTVLKPRAFLFILPIYALLSVVWSEAPSETLKAALEFGVTIVVGLLLSSAPSQRSVLRGLALAFIVYVSSALLQGGTVGIGVGSGGQAFSGLTESKNLLGDIASSGALISLVVAVMAIARRNWIWFAIGLAGVALAIQATAGARSAGAMLGLGMGLGTICLLLPLLAVGKVVRAWLTSVVTVCLIVIGLNLQTLAEALIAWGAQVFDKDPTLTGRTYLWYRAADLIQEKPWLGRGYHAFWQQGNTDAEGLWRYFGITERGGFTFHNTPVEILVALGWIGLVVVATTVFIGVFALIRRFVVRPSLALVCWVGLLLYQLARTPIETIGISPFYFSTVLAFAALGAAFGRVRPATQNALPGRHLRPGAVQVWSANDFNRRPGRTPHRLAVHSVRPGR